MAKSARASVVKRNHRNLRAKVFGPAHDARTARLSAKLQELAAKPRPTDDKVMEVETPAEQEAEDQSSNEGAEDVDMDVDAQGAKTKRAKSQSRADKKQHRVSKKKAKHQMVFASERARRRKTASKPKSKQ
ncbi:hypothetical protein ABEF93_001741 [Exophiala dermatitidis]